MVSGHSSCIAMCSRRLKGQSVNARNSGSHNALRPRPSVPEFQASSSPVGTRGRMRLLFTLYLTPAIAPAADALTLIPPQRALCTLSTSQLYPGGWRDETASRLLASKYEAIIKAGDFELWDKAADSRPVGLDAWKVAVQDAYVRLSESRREIGLPWPFLYPLDRFRPQPTSAAVKVNGMQVEGKVEQTWERAEGEEEEPSGEAELYKMQAGKAKLGNRGKGKGKHSIRLYTDEEYERMKKTDLCLYCAKKGHRISVCPDKAEGKPRTKATPEQLKGEAWLLSRKSRPGVIRTISHLLLPSPRRLTAASRMSAPWGW